MVIDKSQPFLPGWSSLKIKKLLEKGAFLNRLPATAANCLPTLFENRARRRKYHCLKGETAF
jgi:hypothetical protein